jgi:hypothetical protein
MRWDRFAQLLTEISKVHGRPLRTGGVCMLDAGHKGKRCTSVAFLCDTCGVRRRGRPHAVERNPWDDVIEVEQCWFCNQVLGPIYDRQAMEMEMQR